eukprot:15326068-Ditylum_brightwellii.AAC.1
MVGLAAPGVRTVVVPVAPIERLTFSSLYGFSANVILIPSETILTISVWFIPSLMVRFPVLRRSFCVFLRWD